MSAAKPVHRLNLFYFLFSVVPSLSYYIHYYHINSNQLKAALYKRDEFKYKDDLSAEIREERELFSQIKFSCQER